MNQVAATNRLRVLVVEDEEDIQELMRYNLTRHGYQVLCVGTGEQALREIHHAPPDLIVLDLMLPGMDGLEVCRAVRSDPHIAHLPIIMVTAKGEEADVVAGLELGADDYLTKPFSPRVLAARLKAVLRRRAETENQDTPEEEAGQVIRTDSLLIDSDRHEVRVDGELADLTATEFRLLKLLASRPGRVFTRQQIIEAIHGDHCAVTDRSVDVLVVALRRKLGDAGQEIQTVRGVGYRFRD